MSFTPIITGSGYSGWKILTKTLERQEAAFAASSAMKNDEAYFKAKIGSISTAEELVEDHRLLKVALGAFGLEDDIKNKFFIKKVLAEGTLDADSFANKLSDKRYLKLSEAFGFGDYSTPRTKLSYFADEILDPYKEKSFQISVGEINSDYRLGLNFSDEFADLADNDSSVNAKWYSILASEPLRTVFENALGLPSTMSALDIDVQLSLIKKKAESVLGSSDPAELNTTETKDKIVKLHIVRSGMSDSTSTSPFSTALQLLSNMRS